jgi:hypothetical protein
MSDYSNRNWTIFSTDDTGSLDTKSSDVIGENNKYRTNRIGSLTFLKWEGSSMPTSLSALGSRVSSSCACTEVALYHTCSMIVTASGPTGSFSYSEIMTVLGGAEWTPQYDISGSAITSSQEIPE